MRTDQELVNQSGNARAILRFALAGAALWLLTIAAAPCPDANAQDAAGAARPEVAKLFEKQCSQCHTVPDQQIRSDRAWLDQVHRTA